MSARRVLAALVVAALGLLISATPAEAAWILWRRIEEWGAWRIEWDWERRRATTTEVECRQQLAVELSATHTLYRDSGLWDVRLEAWTSYTGLGWTWDFWEAFRAEARNGSGGRRFMYACWPSDVDLGR